MVTMSLVRKEVPKKKGLLSRLKASVTPERKQKAVSVAKQMGRGAGVMGRGLASGFQRLGANVQASGMFSEVEQPKRSEYLPTSKRYKKARKDKKGYESDSVKKIRELRKAGLI